MGVEGLKVKGLGVEGLRVEGLRVYGLRVWGFRLGGLGSLEWLFHLRFERWAGAVILDSIHAYNIPSISQAEFRARSCDHRGENSVRGALRTLGFQVYKY